MNCCICNKNINVFNSKSIKNEHICKDCYNHLPLSIKKHIINFMSYELTTFIDFDKTYHNKLISKFKKTSSYGDVYLDEHNGFIAFSKKINNDDSLPDMCHDIYNVLEIEDIDLAMKNPIAKNNNIYADIELYCKIHNPNITITKIIKRHEKCQTIKNKNGYEYNIPPILDMFINIINRARNTAIQKESIKINEFFMDEDKKNYELAKATFMIDDNDTFDLNILKTQRNKLLKIYHPDECLDDENSIKYTQKINNAYKILKQKIGD